MPDVDALPNVRFPVATLCDAANVREGTISILSGGITRLWRSQFPCQMGVGLALMCEYDPAIFQRPSEIRVRIEDADGGMLHEASMVLPGQPLPDSVDPGESVSVPLVLSLREAPLERPGRYRIVVDPMDETVEPVLVSFRVDYPPLPQE